MIEILRSCAKPLAPNKCPASQNIMRFKEHSGKSQMLIFDLWFHLFLFIENSHRERIFREAWEMNRTWILWVFWKKRMCPFFCLLNILWNEQVFSSLNTSCQIQKGLRDRGKSYRIQKRMILFIWTDYFYSCFTMYLNIVVVTIPHICHFFYTIKFFGEWNLHRNLHSNCQFTQ